MTRGRIAAIAGLVFVIALALWWILQPNDEERVLRRLAAMQEEFNAGAAGGLIACFATDFSDQTTDLTRGELQAVFFRYFQIIKRDEDKRPLVHVEYVDGLPQSVEFRAVTKGEVTSQTAHVTCLLQFTERATADAPPKDTWQVRVDGEFAEYDGDWLLKATQWETTKGQMPHGF
ncbi:MAG: hypothetical protein ACKVX7_09265 [Planctomycetota bacterium]